MCEATKNSLNPQYIIKEIEQELIESLRNKEKYVKYENISGSSKFRIAIIQPDSTIIKAAPYLCACEKCQLELGACDLFDDYGLVSHNLNKVFIRSNNRCQNAREDTDDEDDDIIDLIPPNTICAIAAGSGHEILWFVNIYLVNTACDLVSDKQGHMILPGQVYITGRYLEKKRES